VGMLDGRSECEQEQGGGLGSKGPLTVEPVGQAAAGEVLHAEKQAAAALVEGQDANDIRMIQPGDDSAFAAKTSQLPAPLAVAQDLEGNRAIQADVPGPVDVSLAA